MRMRDSSLNTQRYNVFETQTSRNFKGNNLQELKTQS